MPLLFTSLPSTLPSTCGCSTNICWMLKGAGQFLHPFEGNRDIVFLSHIDQLGPCRLLPSSLCPQRLEGNGEAYYVSTG